MQESLLDLDLKHIPQFAGRKSVRSLLHESLSGREQVSVPREVRSAIKPQALIIELGNVAERVVLATVRIAGLITQGFQFTKNGHGCWSGCNLLQFCERGDFLSLKKRSKNIGCQNHWYNSSSR